MADTTVKEIEKYSSAGVPLYTINVAALGIRLYISRVAVDSKGVLYVVNSHNRPDFPHSILVYDNQGKYLRTMSFVTGTGNGQVGTIRGLAVGPGDQLYTVDSLNRRIQVFDQNGVFIRKFGTSGFGACKLGSDLRGIAIDAANGLVYVSDASQSQVLEYDFAGNCLATFTVPGPAPGVLGGPRELTVGLDHNVYVADYTGDRVVVFSPSGSILSTIPAVPEPAPDGGFNQLEGVAVNLASGSVYVTDTFNHRVQEFTSTGTFLGKWGYRGSGAYGLNYPRGIAVDQATGEVWVDNTRSGEVKIYSSTGTFLRRFGVLGDGVNDTPQEYWYERGVWVGSDGRGYVPDSGNLRVKIVDKLGNVLKMMPCGLKGPPTNSILEGCLSITTDAAGNIYAAAPSENAIYKWDHNGNLLTKWGSKGSGPGQFNGAYGVAVNGGRLYVSDMNNNRICVYTLTGTYLSSFGSYGGGHGSFNRPTGLAFDAAGNLYITDTGNERVEVYSTP
jgi:DNA-binding beta-propeller fold protein YncE